MDDRAVKIHIGNKEYELLLTTKATKEIATRYGGLENLGDKLSKNENFEQTLDEVVWLICTLANQTILIRNLTENAKEPLLTSDEVELLTTPKDLASYNEAITECLYKGTKRNIESEENPKNGEKE